jgi:hypothetical protein
VETAQRNEVERPSRSVGLRATLFAIQQRRKQILATGADGRFHSRCVSRNTQKHGLRGRE